MTKRLSELTVAEQVFIAAIPNNPTRYNPLTNYDNTVGRRDLILGKLYENDMINSMNYYTALDTPGGAGTAARGFKEQFCRDICKALCDREHDAGEWLCVQNEF